MNSFKPSFLPQCDKSHIVGELKRVTRLIGDGPFTIKEFEKHARVAVTTIRRKFGSWPAALEAADLGHLINHSAPAKKSRVLARSLADEEILEEIKRVAKSLSKSSLTAAEFNQHASIGTDAVRNRFGSLGNAFRKAGLRENSHAKRYTDEECFENLLAVWMHYGRQPTHNEMNTEPSKVGSKAYTKRWKSWRKAIWAFESKMNEEPDSPAPATQSTIQLKPRLSPEDRRDIPSAMRYRVLMRDLCRCVLCGRSPANEPGVMLHIDHIQPHSKGGKTVESNLRCLCKDCNLGKGSSE